MRHYAGLDVSMKETSVCIVDETGAVCREMKVFSHPDDLARALKHPAWRLDRIGLEAGPLSQWLFSGCFIFCENCRLSERSLYRGFNRRY